MKKPKFRNYWLSLVFAIVIITLVLSSMLIIGFYGSTNDDGAFHTLVTRIILDNPQALLTRNTQPYANFFLIYPSSTHILSAFFVTLLNVPIQKIVIMMTVVFPALIGLAFYCTIKSLFKGKLISILGLITASFFAVGLSWAPIGWGGLPLLMSLYTSISCLGLIFVLLKQKMTWLSAFLMGLLFFVVSQTYPVALLITVLWSILVLISNFSGLSNLRKTAFNRFVVNVKSLTMIIAFLVPLLFSLPYYYYSLSNRSSAGVSFTELSSNLENLADSARGRISFNWLFDIPALAVFYSEFGELLALASLSLIIMLVLVFLPKYFQRIISIYALKQFRHSLLLVYSLMITIMAYLTVTLYLPINFFTALFEPERVWQHVFIPGVILTAVVLFSGVFFIRLSFKRFFSGNSAKMRKGVLAIVLISVIIASLSFPIISSQQQYSNIGSNLNKFETLDKGDILLMKWIAENVDRNSLILISPTDSGQFLTAVTQRQTVSQYSFLNNYTDLMEYLTSNPSDLRAVPVLKEYDVSFVFIGSRSIALSQYSIEHPEDRHLNATQFLSTSYFTLTKEIGNSWLFEFNSAVALTDFNKMQQTTD